MAAPDSAPMPIYRCYFLDHQEHIEAAENVDAEHLDEAVEQGLAMLQARPDHYAIEIWQGALRLYAVGAHSRRHQCHIYEGSPSQTLPAMAAVIQRQLKENIRCMYLNSPPMITGIKFYLTSAGVDLEEETEKGSLLLSSDREHLAAGDFDADLMLNMLEAAVSQAVEEGYRGLWASGDMTWELGPQQSVADLVRYEWQLEEIFRRQPALCGICQYHIDSLPRDGIRQGLLAHPAIFVNETLSRLNPHYVGSEPRGADGNGKPRLDEFINHLCRSGSPSV